MARAFSIGESSLLVMIGSKSFVLVSMLYLRCPFDELDRLPGGWEVLHDHTDGRDHLEEKIVLSVDDAPSM